jgi:hypothetical protein
VRARRGREENFLETTLRVAWGRRIEMTVVAVAGAARWAIFLAFLHTGQVAVVYGGQIVLAVAAGTFICTTRTRRWLVDALCRERVERQFDLATVNAGVATAAVTSIRAVPSGSRLTLSIPPGSIAEDYDKASEALAVCFRSRGVRVLRDPANAGRAELTIVTCDPLGGAGTPWPGVGMHRTNLWAPLPLGVDEDGVAVVLDLAGHHVLVGGEPGAGKSNALSMIVATAALDPNVDLWCLDAKLVELAPWRELSKAFVGPDIEEATVALGVLQAEMTNRYQWLLEQKLRKVTPDTGLGLVLVVIDEMALYIQGKGKERDEFALGLRDLVARGRAAGIVVVAATQKPAADVVPTAVRDLFGYRLALRCSTREASDTVLGSGWAAAGFSAADIDPATRGVGLLLAETGVPRRLRCHHVTDADIDAIVHRAISVRSAGGRP